MHQYCCVKYQWILVFSPSFDSFLQALYLLPVHRGLSGQGDIRIEATRVTGNLATWQEGNRNDLLFCVLVWIFFYYAWCIEIYGGIDYRPQNKYFLFSIDHWCSPLQYVHVTPGTVMDFYRYINKYVWEWDVCVKNWTFNIFNNYDKTSYLIILY